MTDLLDQIINTAEEIKEKIQDQEQPSMDFPVRSLSNVEFDEEEGYLRIGDRTKKRTLNVNTVKKFAQALRMFNLSRELIENDDFATKREAYYMSKNWDKAGFKNQDESDSVMDDVEAFFRVNREQLRFNPEEKGGEVAGPLTVIDEDPASGEKIRIDCTDFGTGAYSIPISVEDLEFESDADFIMAIETAGMFQRLVKHDYYDQANCILVSMGGVPTRALRRFIRRTAEELDLPVYAFVDGDPYGMFNIYRTLKVGSGNAAHINDYFCAPMASFLGVDSWDVERHDLPTHPLSDRDIKRAKDALDNDPFVQKHEKWQAAIEKFLDKGVRCEQQAFARWGLDYVVEEYLPEKMENTEDFLP